MRIIYIPVLKQIIFCSLSFFQFTGELLEDVDPTFEAIAAFDRDGNEIITPDTHFILKVLPVLRYLPGYYGDLYRRTIRSRNNLRTVLLNKMKVIPGRNE